MTPAAIRRGSCYSNGAYGRAWGVRMVLRLTADPESGLETVTFKGLAGICRRRTETISREEFANWARYEVALNENSWQRVGHGAPEEG